MICKNCGHNFEGKFCNNCGQKSNVGEINFKYIIDEIANSVFQVDKGFFYSIKELFTRPGHSIRHYIEGKRRQHFKPIAFIFITATIYFISNLILKEHTFLGNFLLAFVDGMNRSEFDLSTTTKILNWLATNYAYATLILLPLFSLASYLSFKKSGYNYFEHLVLNAYIKGQQIIIFIFFSFIFIIFNKEEYKIELLPFLIGFLFTIWVYCQFFKNKKFLVKTLLTILTYILYNILIISISLIIMFLIIIF